MNSDLDPDSFGSVDQDSGSRGIKCPVKLDNRYPVKLETHHPAQPYYLAKLTVNTGVYTLCK